MTDPGAPDIEDGRVLAGRFRLVRPIARGGMAEVWEAQDVVLTRPIAVKLLHPQLAADERFRERFRREAVAAARLSHPNVVATFDTGEDGDTAFIVMELVRGRTLKDLLASDGPPAPAVVAAIGIQVAEALQHAHEAGLVHRDVKPGNILVCDGERGAPIQVKVADFGIARAAAGEGADLTQPGSLLGTAKYLSPEQVEGGEPDARSDIYALGVVLYECLTGRPPFDGDTEMATALAHVANEPLKPRQLRAGIPRELEAVVTRAMAKDPAARYQSAVEVCSALRSLDLGEDDALPAVTRDATPPSGMAPSFRQTERSWLVPAVVIVAIAVALGVVGVVFSRSEVGHEILGRKQPATGTATGEPIRPSSIHTFDPEGDGSENENKALLAIDGDNATLWATDTYRTQAFGNLKKGVGIFVELPNAAKLQRMHVASSSDGWDAEVFVADRPGTKLADWGDPVATAESISGSHDFDLGGRSGSAVLIWITHLGSDDRVELAEVTLQGTPAP